MSVNLNIGLTQELRDFIDNQSGEGTLYATPSEFLRDIIRREKARIEAATMRDAILEGYDDLISGRSLHFSGDLRSLVKEAKKRDNLGWK